MLLDVGEEGQETAVEDRVQHRGFVVVVSGKGSWFRRERELAKERKMALDRRR